MNANQRSINDLRYFTRNSLIIPNNLDIRENSTVSKEGLEYASLTDIITRTWSGFTTKQYKHYKGLKKENLRDNMTNLEMAFNILAEASSAELSKQNNPKGYNEQVQVAKEGGSVAKAARRQLESKLGHSVISPSKASDYLLSKKDNEAKKIEEK